MELGDMLMEKNKIVKDKGRLAVLAHQFLESVWLACPWWPVKSRIRS